MNYLRKCKTCGKDISYKLEITYRRSLVSNSDCKTCSALKRPPKSEEVCKRISQKLKGRIIPIDVIEKIRNTIKEKFNTSEYKQKFSILHSGKNNGMFGKHHTNETREKISKITKQKMSEPEIKEKIFKIQHSVEYKTKLSNALKGRIHTEESKQKMRGPRFSLQGKNNPMYGKKHSYESLRKMSLKARMNSIKQAKRIVELGGELLYPRYNLKACKLIDEYGRQNGYNFQHAMNGGEFCVEELGYWVDAYDKEKNVVLEIDEKQHFKPDGTLKDKDVIRQKEIEGYLKCKFIRIPFINKN